MARLYSRKRGKSRSKKPLKGASPSWLRHKPKEVEMLVVKLAKEGKNASRIGLILRDQYGVGSVEDICKKKISRIIEEHKLAGEVPDDLMALIKRSVMIRKHLETNHKDMTALRGLQLTESKIKRLVNYYKKEGRLPVSWKYDVKVAGLMVE